MLDLEHVTRERLESVLEDAFNAGWDNRNEGRHCPDFDEIKEKLIADLTYMSPGDYGERSAREWRESR